MSTLLLGMSSRTTETGLVWQLMKKITIDPEVQGAVLEKSQGLPVRREVVLKAARDKWGWGGAESVDLEAISRIMDEAVCQPQFRDQRAVITMAENAIQEIYAGKKPLSMGLHKLQKEVNAYLQR